MPHDANGKLLKVGDIVMVPAKVKAVNPGEDFCNVTLESVRVRKPDSIHETLTLNAAVVELVETVKS